MGDSTDQAQPVDDTGEAGGLIAAKVLDAVGRRLEEPRTLPLRAVADHADLDPQLLARLFSAAGRLHDDGSYGDRDLQYARDLAVLVERFDPDTLERALRMHVRAATAVAVNQLGLIQADQRLAGIFGDTQPEGLDDMETLERFAEVLAEEAALLVPLTQRLLVEDHHETLVRLLETQVVREASRTLGDVVELSVAFIDLVGFTRLSASVEPAGVGGVLAAFEDLVHLAADLAGDVLVVKFIGDAAMLVSGHLDQLVDACLRIVEAEVEALEDVARRAGVASGRVQIRDGDYVGTPVNLAARLTDLARPGTVVADEELQDRLEPGWDLSRLPSLKLKGLGRGRHLRVRRPAG